MSIVPQINVKADNHVHTRLCNHATGEMEDYVLAAIQGGLETLTFLEHLEAGIDYFERTWLTPDDFSLYFEEGKRLQEIYHDRITIQLGVEVGYNPSAVEQIKDRLSEHKWDQKGLSYHFFFDGQKHLNMVSRRQENIDALAAIGPDQVLNCYFDDLAQAVRVLDCDVLCHLDAVMRHHQGLEFKPSHWDKIDVLLQQVHDKAMKLEVNTSGFALRETPYPDIRIIRRAVELGIPLVAGSDAHRPDQVGRYFDRLPGFINS